jgi:penicillin-binding protein 2
VTGGDDRIRFRITVLAVLVIVLMSLLMSRLWFLQVLAGEKYKDAALENHVRIATLQAPRGRILDRNGSTLVDNRASLVVGIRKDDLPDDNQAAYEIKKRLASMLGITPKQINKRLADRRVSSYRAAPVAEDVPRDVFFQLAERGDEFPGVEVSIVPVRSYPHGLLAAHVVGYVGETNEEELERLQPKGYRLGDSIGRTGIERSYEDVLRGRPGYDKLEVDASGRVLRTLGHRDPIPGADLYLSIDLKAQKVAEAALLDGIRSARGKVFRLSGQHFKAPAGGVVVLNAQTGGVVAMASYPTFDPRLFVGGVDARYYRHLNDPRNHFPLLSRATQSAYPPGSTIKPLMAVAALETGLASPAGSYPCTSGFRFGDRVFHNWTSGSGSISLPRALEVSCDTVFYRFGAAWWARERNAERAGRKVYESMQDWDRQFGLGADTGIDLPVETTGNVPGRESRLKRWQRNKRAWCREARRTHDRLLVDLCENGWRWRGGDSINLSIGQGELQVSPLQLARAYAAIANGGKVFRPHVGLKVVSLSGKTLQRIKPEVVRRLGSAAPSLDRVRRWLAGVPEHGTAGYPYRNWPFSRIRVAAKTGSSEIEGKQPFSWFASFVPVNRPRYVAVSVVEEAGFGSQVSGPIVRRIMDQLFGLTPTPIVFGGRSD